MKRSLVTLIVLLAVIAAHAELHFSDSLRISLLTVADGEDAYECFGHTGLRIHDLKAENDIVFHYGVYNYTEPNFVWHFVEGKCNYRMGACYTDDFLLQHRMRQLSITEQILDLNTPQKTALTQALLENYRPQNRNYRYNFFFDNCATRPFEMIGRCAEIAYDTTWIEPKSLRDMVQEKSGQGNWLDFGISLAIAGRADQPTTFKEQMFLPSYLKQALDHAQTEGHPLVSETVVHPFGDENATGEPEGLPSPLMIAIGLLLIATGITLGEKYRPNTWLKVGQSLDTFWLLATGLAGCIIWFLNFGSEHPAVDNNLNCMWLLPTNVLFIAFIWIKKAKKVRRIYFFIIFAAEFIYIIGICTCAQYVHPAFIPLLLTLGIRSAMALKANR